MYTAGRGPLASLGKLQIKLILILCMRFSICPKSPQAETPCGRSLAIVALYEALVIIRLNTRLPCQLE